jgi:hypothetical protein
VFTLIILANEQLTTSIEDQEMFDWLLIDYNLAPWDLVLKNWVKTFKIRQVAMTKIKENKIPEIFNKFAVLKDIKGYELVSRKLPIKLPKIFINNTNFLRWFMIMKPFIKNYRAP